MAIVVTSVERAKDLKHRPVVIEAASQDSSADQFLPCRRMNLPREVSRNLTCSQVVEVDDAILNGSRDQGGFRGCRTPDRRIPRAHPL